ncbi:hypothetical protein [Solemya velesiana gill symbiont]|uniref:Uncharacterized protein n=1 Tax=Solemya velesiana gill symbiont TaxID=1918948 RepID=A0A1T2KV21_9GAMM|nr:hypothetical protein [Solemya velesiana gill symbiont]OOZ36718.1 hypothetical protein BOW51_05795 [Solemya velesiana gill symbiont]
MAHPSVNYAALGKVTSHTVIAVAVWTLIVAVSLGWNILNEQYQAFGLAQEEARASFDKDQAFRLWATRHGGVYVLANERRSGLSAPDASHDR